MFFALVAFALPSLVSCGYSEDQWKAQLARYKQLEDSSKATEAKLKAELKAERDRVADLMKQLEAAGLDMSKVKADLDAANVKLSALSLTLDEQQKALIEYQQRAKQLEMIKARFEALRKKLDALTKLGLAVTIRHNRMVISLPGDVLFDSGRETLSKAGQDILLKVAGIIKADASLLARDYQVAGHTDNVAYGGVFRDNWGLSLMRAREVLLFLVSNNRGGMPVQRWSAAGFGDTDPIADNSAEEGRQKNRRCDLIVVPSVEEMLDLKAITQ
ncbi:MAG: OmpA family protein [Polyangiaceae bacterium]|nr:OmpA family protein [Polyangiaceae bacterium]